MADPVLASLQRIERLLERVANLLAAQCDDCGMEPGCPKCNAAGDMLTDTSTGNVKRVTCLECGESVTLEAPSHG